MRPLGSKVEDMRLSFLQARVQGSRGLYLKGLGSGIQTVTEHVLEPAISFGSVRTIRWTLNP